MRTAREILHEKATKNNDGFLSGQIRWIVDAMEEYAKEYYTEAKKLNKAPVKLRCQMCEEEWMGEPPEMCCSGRDCGCMGLPIEPILCSAKCGEKLFGNVV